MKSIKTRIHWNKREKRWTAKTSKGCPRFPFILVKGGWSAEVKPHLKTNPRGFVLTTDEKVHFIDEETANTLLQERKNQKLHYNKEDMSFNIEQGDDILFTPSGAYILE